MANLSWENLKELKCPKCYYDLLRDTFTSYYCERDECNFKIKLGRLREIVIPMFTDSGDYFGRAEFEEMIANDKK